MIGNNSEMSNNVKDEFKDLMKHSEKIAKKFWGNKADKIWDMV